MTAPHLAFVPSFLTAPDAVALCSEVDPESWFPEKGSPSQFVKDMCRRCELEGDCLEWALTHDEEGVWGGTTENERRNIKRGRPPVRQRARTWTDQDTKDLVLNLTYRDWSTEEIARELNISTRTVSRIRVAASEAGAA